MQIDFLHVCYLVCVQAPASANYKLHVEAPNLHARSPHSCPSQSNDVQTIGSSPNSKRLQKKSATCVFTQTHKFIVYTILYHTTCNIVSILQNSKWHKMTKSVIPESSSGYLKVGLRAHGSISTWREKTHVWNEQDQQENRIGNESGINQSLNAYNLR